MASLNAEPGEGASGGSRPAARAGSDAHGLGDVGGAEFLQDVRAVGIVGVRL